MRRMMRINKIVRSAALAAVLLGATTVAAWSSTAAAAECYSWHAQVSLQTAVNNFTCVEVQTGTWKLPRSLLLGPGRTLRGAGAPGQTILTPVTNGTWPRTIGDGVVNDAGSTSGKPAGIANLTLDANGIATYGLCCRHFTARRLIVRDAPCSGVGIAGPNVTLEDSQVTGNGFACANSPPGAGIYVVKSGAAPNTWAPRIVGNNISNNDGPGLDIDGVWGGRLVGNTIASNASWAGLSLIGASNWLVENNTIHQPATTQGQPYQPVCRGGPAGVRSAAIIVCQLTDANNYVAINNIIRNNRASGGYGILLIGNDQVAPYLAPRNNTITGNNVVGSVHGCADDFRPGQWGSDRNTWSGCQVTYF